VVMADHTKWGTTGLSSFAALDEVDVLITDAGIPPDARQALTERVGRLVVAGEPDPDRATDRPALDA